jgi:plastocyanin
MRPSRALVLCAFLTAACGGGGGGGTDAPVVASIALSPGAFDTLFARGATAQLTVQAKDAAGNIINRPSLSFTSGNQGIATVSSTGLITAQGNGKTSISVSSGSVSQSIDVVVRRKVASITVSPPTRSLAPTQTQLLTVRALDPLGVEIVNGVTPTFVSSNTSAATVDGNGLVTAVANGTSNITVTAVTVDGTRTATAQISVVTQTFPAAANVTLTAGSFEPDVVDIIRGGSVTWTNNSGGTLHNVTFATLTANNISAHTSGSSTRSFDNAGTFNYQCTLHPGMNGSVVVH